ncbi:hypothetical protein DYB32_004867 [Aphanomyces invadans]|uniref:Uncharacterized protein n=1 Tax=Aphanomyces invadans TaxID=157072 RepID=A0A3R6WLT4_9STRA|nr:hypothetical protein DYB32_004867 [Aphanomyces invadans]
MSAPATGSSRVRMSLDDSLRLVHDILDEDRSFLEYLHDENVTERDRVHHALHQASVTSTTAIRPEKYINETCHELQHELEQLESELSFYDTMKRTTSSKATRGSGQHEQAHGGGSVAPRARAHPTRQPPKKKTVPAPHTPIVATSFDSMIAKLQRDYEHDKAAHLDAQARIQARVAAAHKDAMVLPNDAISTCLCQEEPGYPESHVLPDPEEVSTIQFFDYHLVHFGLHSSATTGPEASDAVVSVLQADLVALEERLRHVVSDELLAKRQEVATALLQREEELLQQGRAQALAMHQANERDEVAKLQEALQLGSSLRLQQVRSPYTRPSLVFITMHRQLRERLDGQRAAKLAQIERVANESLERSLEHLRNEHDADTVQLVHTTQDRLRQVERIREEHDLRRADRLAQLQQTYEAEYIVRMETLQEDLNAQLTATLSERAAEHSRALQKEIDTRTQHFADVTDRLTSELHFWFQVVKHQPGTLLPKERRQDDGGEAPDAIAKLNALGITNREVNQWIHTIRSEFFDLSDQHKVLVESLRQASVVASSSKQKVAALEDALARQEAKLDKAMVDIHEKTRLCQRLYNANEQLLKQLPAASPP